MATRKKTGTKRGAGAAPIDEITSAGARQFTIVLEEIHAKFGVFGEALETLRDEMRRGFERVDRRFEQVDARFDQVDARFERVDRRFERTEARVAQIDTRVAQIDTRVAQIDTRVAQIDTRVGNVESRFDRVDRDLGLIKSAVIENGRALKRLAETVEKKPDRDEVVLRDPAH